MRSSLLACIASFGICGVVAALQETVLFPQNITQQSSYGFQTLRHAAFPKYAVRVKKTDFCDSTVGAYTGYIDIEARHIFFYFFDSRRDPENDDVILWTNGCSGASMGLFMEIGPCKVTGPEAELANNPWAWNEVANMIFIDQPIGTGFSYADYGEYVSTTEEAAIDVAAFVAIFFEYFSHLKGNKLHLAGESYAGRYIPVFASEIYDQNTKLSEAGMTPINLASIIIANGCTDMLKMYPSYYEVQCQHKTFPPVTEISRCVEMKRALPRCEKWLKEGCFDNRDLINCNAAVTYCEALVMDPFRYNGRNPYDLSKPCEGKYVETLCYPVTKTIAKYLEREDVRRQIGVDPVLPAKFSGCAWDVKARFRNSQDHLNPTQHYIGALLDRGIRVLLYIGENDWMCNWVANERMSLDLEWHGQADFTNSSLRPWTYEDHVAGLTRNASLLTYATIKGAGHMAPYDKPRETLDLIRKWLAEQPL
ncbi:serine carboxypeptidase [Trametopsis cervina]|nr:serine carboxypeptidase [Trametopsis cervina]